jgi:hypothetical protein
MLSSPVIVMVSIAQFSQRVDSCGSIHGRSKSKKAHNRIRAHIYINKCMCIYSPIYTGVYG